MFLIYDMRTKQAIRCHGCNDEFINNTPQELKKDLHLKNNEDYIKLNKSCIDEIRSKAFDNL
ncbi:hypothetical protein SH1V18_07430 [Vallitalea longa]|uniref:Uncharacterized protein n=1 Tax=Vallitalea longa TaxID=2936439 RepID=A0A9W6DEB8_9FIRM|nr:hypothetical protein [Vallitalea longa]GKX28263.1 hypothetical protein SH1V18_07430 [Vallitalea longa]